MHARVFYFVIRQAWLMWHEAFVRRRALEWILGTVTISVNNTASNRGPSEFFVVRVALAQPAYTRDKVSNYHRTVTSPRWMIRGWDDEDVIDAEEAGPARKEKSGVGRGLIGRHHNCPVRDRTDSRNFLSRPTSSGAIFFQCERKHTVLFPPTRINYAWTLSL